MIEVVVGRKVQATRDIAVFELRARDGSPLPAFDAGAHIDVEIGPGLVRQYSLCNRPGATDGYRIAVLRDPASRGGSVAMSQVLQGAHLRISAPRNHFALAPMASSARLFAGGIGITPILAMARQLWEDGVAFRLWYAGRSRAGMAFCNEIAKSAFASFSTLHADDEAGGLLDLQTALAGPRPGEHAYVCGPTAYIEAVLAAARRQGWSEEALHREHFSAQAPASQTEDQPFTLRLARSGLTIEVAANRTALDTLLDAGVALEASCEQGVCGTCLTPVLSGVPDHRDMVLSDAEHAANDQFTPCCSRALTKVLEIDL